MRRVERQVLWPPSSLDALMFSLESHARGQQSLCPSSTNKTRQYCQRARYHLLALLAHGPSRPHIYTSVAYQLEMRAVYTKNNGNSEQLQSKTRHIHCRTRRPGPLGR